MSLAALALVDTAPHCAPLAELFTADHDDHPARPDQLAQVCARCPLLEPCRADAIRDPRVGGFAGGLTASQRDDIRAGRPPRRLPPPPKEPRMTDIAPVRFADEIRDALEQGRAPAAVAQELLVPVTEVLAVQKQMQQQAQPASPQLVVLRRADWDLWDATRAPRSRLEPLGGNGEHACSPQHAPSTAVPVERRTGDPAVEPIERVLPFLRVKRDQALIALSLQEHVVAGRGDDPFPWFGPDYDPEPYRDECRRAVVEAMQRGGPTGAHDEHGRRVGKTKAGRLLDGRTWDEFPEAVPA